MQGAAKCNIYPLTQLAKLNPVLRIGVIAQMVERRNDDPDCWTKLDRARGTPLFFFQQ